MEHVGISKNQIISSLVRSAHGDLKSYTPAGLVAAVQEPDFFAHLIAWNHINGQMRDSKVALPVCALWPAVRDPEHDDNALAHIASLDPRNFLRALDFAKEQRTPGVDGVQRRLRRLCEQYLRFRESSFNHWERSALQHRASMKSLYARWHIAPSGLADSILFKGQYPSGSLFDLVRRLKGMSPSEAAGTILRRRIPFLIAQGALGPKAKEPELVLALIHQMSPTELITNSKMLERLGVASNPALRGAYDEALNAAAASKQSVLKTTRATVAVTDTRMKARLDATQEKQLKASIEGDWLVLADKSSSMKTSIELGRQVAAILARMVKGQVHIVFFDNMPQYYFNASGKTLEEITEATRRVSAGGGTSIGCGLLYAVEKGLSFQGVAIVSDGGEGHGPTFDSVFQRSFSIDLQPPVYLYHVPGDPNVFERRMTAAGIDMQTFELSSQTDYYSLPNLVATMNLRRYTLIDQIMETPLLRLEAVFTREKEAEDALA